MPASEALFKKWRPLHLLNLYRVLIAGSFVALVITGIQVEPFGVVWPKLFNMVSFAYLIFAVMAGVLIRMRWPDLTLQAHLAIFTDLVALSLLMHASGGVSSGVALLMITPVAASSITLRGNFSYFYAAVASLLMLLDQLYLQLQLGISDAYPLSGILGMLLFLTALVTHKLVAYSEESQLLAEQRALDLADMEQLTAFIMQRMQTGVIVVDHLGNVRLMNSSAEKLLDRRYIESIRLPLMEYSKPLCMAFNQWGQANRQVADSESAEDSVKEIKLENSSIKPRFARLGQGKRAGAVIFLEDPSQLAQQAQQLKLASLGRLTASIAHEIRNPLAAISHAGALLSESPDIAEADKRLTQIIDKQSHRVNSTINTILSLSKRTPTAPVDIALCDWLKEFVAQFSEQPPERFNLRCDKTLTVEFDTQHLSQILTNLAQNAFAHTSETEKDLVTLEAGIEESSGSPFINVINPGGPIEEKVVEQLFEPFFTTSHQGTGLGLYIARELAEINGAQLNYVPMDEVVCFRLKLSHPQRSSL